MSRVACSGLTYEAVPTIAPSAVAFVSVGDCEKSFVVRWREPFQLLEPVQDDGDM